MNWPSTNWRYHKLCIFWIRHSLWSPWVYLSCVLQIRGSVQVYQAVISQPALPHAVWGVACWVEIEGFAFTNHYRFKYIHVCLCGLNLFFSFSDMCAVSFRHWQWLSSVDSFVPWRNSMWTVMRIYITCTGIRWGLYSKETERGLY